MLSRLIRNTHYTKLLLLLLLALPMLAQPALAARIRCRSDPIVILSNGAIFDINASIDVFLTQVKEVHYTLHGPVGTSLVTSISTPAWIFSKETFEYIADQEPNTYYATVWVRTSTGDADVTAHGLIITLDGLKIGLHDQDGKEGQTIVLHMD